MPLSQRSMKKTELYKVVRSLTLESEWNSTLESYGFITNYSQEDENTLGALVIHSGTQLNIVNKVDLNPFPSDLFFVL